MNIRKLGAAALAAVFLIPMAMTKMPARAATVNPDLVTGAEVDEMKTKINYVVDQNSKKASDSGAGTEKEPFLTIGQAMRKAADNRKENKGTKIIVKPGIYRETVRVSSGGSNPDAPIILEGTDKGEVFLRGSVIMADPWVKEGDYYTHAWQMGWGPSADIYAADYDIKIEEIVRRKELIHVNGVRMTQTLNKDELEPGRLFVDNDEKKAYFMPLEGMKVEEDSVEVSIHDTLLSFHETGDIHVKNITVDQANSYHSSNAVSIYKVENMIFEDCDFVSNNWVGLGMFDAKNVTLDRVRLNRNGGGGINGSGNDNVMIRDCETSENNWRGVLGGFCDWDTGGIKLLFTYDCVVLRHQAHNNFASGIWFDSECRNITIQECITTGSESPGKGITAGMYIEGNKGPILVTDCIVRDNKRGFNLSSSNDVTIRNTQVVNNRLSQFYIFGNWGYGRTFTERFTGKDVTSYPYDNILENVVISAGPDNKDPLITYDYEDKGGYIVWMDKSTWKDVRVYHPTPETAFLMEDSESRNNLEEWMKVFKREATWVPAHPLNLSLTQDKKNIELKWEKPADDVDGYIIYRDSKEIDRTSELTYTAKLKDADESGIYDVAAYKGDLISARSNYAAFGPEAAENGASGGGAGPRLSQKMLMLLLGGAALVLIAVFGGAIALTLKKRKK